MTLADDVAEAKSYASGGPALSRAVAGRLAHAVMIEDDPPQRQDSLQDQLRDLYAVAVRMGMYDAADYVLSKGDM